MDDGCVVVTGASGYIGSHIVANLLLKGKKVRATVRDSQDNERVKHLKEMEILENGSLEIVEMDLFDEDSVNLAISGATDVIHTAAVVIVRSRRPQEKIVDPSVIGTKNIISAIEKSGTVERFVHTSSTAAIRPEEWEDGEVLTTETFAEDATLEQNPYGLAKYSAEMVVRDWHKQKNGVKKPRMVTIHPCMVFGPPLSPRHLRGSLSIIMMLVNRELPVLLPMQISIVDVRDVAEAHVRALTMGEDGGRYLTVAGEMMWSEELVARHEFNLETKKLAEALGINFAFPTQTIQIEQFPGQESLSPDYKLKPQDQEEELKKYLAGFKEKYPGKS